MRTWSTQHSRLQVPFGPCQYSHHPFFLNSPRSRDWLRLDLVEPREGNGMTASAWSLMRSLAPSAASSAMNYRSSQSYCKICRSARAPICFHILVKVSSWWALAILFTFCWFVVVAGRGALSFFLLLSSSIEYVVVYFPIFFSPSSSLFPFSLRHIFDILSVVERSSACVERDYRSTEDVVMDETEYIITPRKRESEWVMEREEHGGNPAANIIQWLS